MLVYHHIVSVQILSPFLFMQSLYYTSNFLNFLFTCIISIPAIFTYIYTLYFMLYKIYESEACPHRPCLLNPSPHLFIMWSHIICCMPSFPVWLHTALYSDAVILLYMLYLHICHAVGLPALYLNYSLLSSVISGSASWNIPECHFLSECNTTSMHSLSNAFYHSTYAWYGEWDKSYGLMSVHHC